LKKMLKKNRSEKKVPSTSILTQRKKGNDYLR